MASILTANLNLDLIPKDKIYVGKKGKYLPITITINDELGDYGDQGPVIVEQSKEEREDKSPKVYLGNVKVVWTNWDNVSAAPRDGGPQAPVKQEAVEHGDLPF